MPMRVAVAVVLVAGCAAHEGELEQQVKQCATQTVEGIDVSRAQGTINWTQVKGAGREFAFIKATQGDYNKQTTFDAQWSGAKAAGVLRSPYHFFDGTSDGVAQANWFLAELTAAGGLESGDLAPMLDLECPTSSSQTASQSDCEYTGNSGWVPTATLKQRTFDWLTTVEAATGRKPYIYSYPSWFTDVNFTDSTLATYPLYIASYNACATVPAPWTQAVFWQYSATGTVPGVTGQVDEDRFFGSAGDLTGQTGTTPRDAGVGGDGGTNSDAGNGAQGAGRAGCGCRATHPGWLAAFAACFAFMLRRRRRRRRR
jgi:GH25 family lysozyme M1 (1,4-beta-N-acetylmuramidase)